MILSEEQRTALIAYTRMRARELNYELGDLVPGRNEVYPVHFRNFIWQAPENVVGVFDLRQLVDIALRDHIRAMQPVLSPAVPLRTSRGVFMHQQFVEETDVIGGFPFVNYNCLGCGNELLLANAWMTDGCPCNSHLGVNSMNETRWRLLMQAHQIALSRINDLRGLIQVEDGGLLLRKTNNTVLLELPLDPVH